MRINKPGFNLLEMLLATSMVVLMAGIIAPIAGNLYNRNNLDLASKQIVQNFRRAQTLARASAQDSDWGVYLSGYTSVIFKGSSYSLRDTSFDEAEDLYGRVLSGGLSEIVFAKSVGTPKATGTTTVSIDNEVKYININAKGTISY